MTPMITVPLEEAYEGGGVDHWLLRFCRAFSGTCRFAQTSVGS